MYANTEVRFVWSYAWLLLQLYRRFNIDNGVEIVMDCGLRFAICRSYPEFPDN
jgi:hypothetical protein